MCLPAPRFVARAPAKIVVTLLDEGHYLCSEQMIYRKLAIHRSLRHSRGGSGEATRVSACDLSPSPPSNVYKEQLAQVFADAGG